MLPLLAIQLVYTLLHMPASNDLMHQDTKSVSRRRISVQMPQTERTSRQT